MPTKMVYIPSPLSRHMHSAWVFRVFSGAICKLLGEKREGDESDARTDIAEPDMQPSLASTVPLAHVYDISVFVSAICKLLGEKRKGGGLDARTDIAEPDMQPSLASAVPLAHVYRISVPVSAICEL